MSFHPSKSWLSSAGAKGYHEKDVSDYHAEEAGGVWFGKGAEELGFNQFSKIDAKDWEAVLDRVHPKTGEKLGGEVYKEGDEKRAAFDTVIDFDKSVSIAAVFNRDVHEALIATAKHMTAVGENLAQARLGVDGHKQTIDTGNVVGGLFIHGVNREGSPHDHAHMVFANLTKTADGKWVALENKAMFDNQKDMSIISNVIFAQELEKRGQAYYIDKNDLGSVKIPGYDKPDLEAMYSRNNKENVQAAAAHFREKYPEMNEQKIMDMAIHQTKGRKGESIDPAEKREMIQAEIEKAGYSVEGLAKENAEAKQQMDQQNKGEQAPKYTAKDFLSMATVVKHESELGFSKYGLVAEGMRLAATEYGRSDLTIKDFEKGFKGMVKEGRLELAGREAKTGKISARDIWTTPEAVKMEEGFLKGIEAGKGQGQQIGTREEVMAFIEKYEQVKSEENGRPFEFKDGQRNFILATLCAEDKNILAPGVAGAGKSTALKCIREFAESKDWQVLAVATSGKAASGIKQSTGIDATTIDRFLTLGVEIVDKEKGGATPQQGQAYVPTMHLGNGYKFNSDKGLSRQVKSGNLTIDFALTGPDKGSRTVTNRVGTYFDAHKTDINGGTTRTTGFTKDGATTINKHEVLSVGAKNVRSERDFMEPFANKEDRIERAINGGVGAGAIKVQKDKVLILMDEAGNTPLWQHAGFQKILDEAGGKGCLTGDTKQNAAVAAGSPFKSAIDHTTTTKVELNESTRQRPGSQAWENQQAFEKVFAETREPTKALVAGLQSMKDQGNILTFKDTREAVDFFVVKAIEDMKAGKQATIQVETNALRQYANEKIRAAKVAEGLLAEGEKYNALRPHNMSPEQATSASSYKPGLILNAGENVNSRIPAGSSMRVVSTNPSKNMVELSNINGKGDKTLWVDAGKHGLAFSAFEPCEMNIAPGERIMGLKNDSKVGWFNGEVGTVTRLDKRGNIWAIKDGETKETRFYNGTEPRGAKDGLQYSYLTQADTLTGAKMQGVTVGDRGDQKLQGNVYSVHDGKGQATANSLNPMITRAVDKNMLATTDEKKLFEHANREANKISPHELKHQQKVQERVERRSKEDLSLKADQGKGKEQSGHKYDEAAKVEHQGPTALGADGKIEQAAHKHDETTKEQHHQGPTALGADSKIEQAEQAKTQTETSKGNEKTGQHDHGKAEQSKTSEKHQERTDSKHEHGKQSDRGQEREREISL